MNKQTIYDLKPEGKTVYIRVDYNVPHDKEGHITDDRRIVATLPTLRWLLDHGAALVIASHMGRPKGEVKPDLSLAPVAKRLSELLHMDVKFASDCIGEEAKEKKAALAPGEVLLLENLRFHKEEEKNDPAFAKTLVEGCDLAVNDAFGVSHRSHASIAGVGKLMPMVSGLLLKKEIDFLDGVIEKPERPFAAIIGGAKISDKIQVIANLMEKAAHDMGSEIMLPVDFMAGDAFAEDANTKVLSKEEFQDPWMALDIGPKTIELYVETLKKMKTVVWNGPMGVFEMKPFSKGTFTIARAMADLDATTVIGGGESASVVDELGLGDKFSHVSTGGGASLEMLEGMVLPGVTILADKE